MFWTQFWIALSDQLCFLFAVGGIYNSSWTCKTKFELVTPAIVSIPHYTPVFSIAVKQPGNTEIFHAEWLNWAEFILGRFC